MTSSAAHSAEGQGHTKSGHGKKWWKHPRAKRVGQISVGVLILGFLVWLLFFFPYVSTDDARVSATLIRAAAEGVGGKVIALNVKEGDRVEKDQILLELDHGVSEANLLKAKARATLAEKELKRVQQLAAQNGVPPRDVDNAKAAFDNAKGDLDLAQLTYDRTFVKSPIDGIIVQKVAEVGNIMEPNQTALTIADIENAWVSANIEETAIGHVKAGQRVSIHVDEGGSLKGRVSEVRAATASQFALIQSENASGNFTKLVQRIPIKVLLDPHPKLALRAGESVEIKVRVHW